MWHVKKIFLLDLPKNECKGDLKIKKIIHVKLDFTAI